MEPYCDGYIHISSPMDSHPASIHSDWFIQIDYREDGDRKQANTKGVLIRYGKVRLPRTIAVSQNAAK